MALFAGAIGLQLAASGHPETVERLFSHGLYRATVLLSCLTAVTPFSLAEVGLVAGGTWLAYLLFRWSVSLWREKRLRRLALASGLGNALLAVAVTYVAFLLLWGLNYQRQPFAVSAGLDTRGAGVSELEALCVALVERANDLRGAVAEDEHGVMRAPDGVSSLLARAGAGFSEAARLHPTLAGRCTRPKPVLLSPLLSRLGITGIYSPFTAEANVNTDAPGPELPFATSHEIAHAYGFAREDEANYLGYLACRLHPDPDFRYSGVLAASLYAQAALARRERAAYERLETRRSPAVRRDIDALSAWIARYRGPATEASQRMNNAYLRSQGQTEGVRSYGRMVDLLLAERRARR